MLKEWVMIIEIALTGQRVTIEVASEEECKSAMERTQAGEKMNIYLKTAGGTVAVPVERVLRCVSKNGDGGGVS
jgi:hypothetical protein